MSTPVESSQTVVGSSVAQPTDGRNPCKASNLNVPSTRITVLPLVLLLAASGALRGAPPVTVGAALVSYDAGTDASARHMNPFAALGDPSETNPFGEPTDPFNPPYGTNQIVSIGAGGHLTLRFDTPVLNHPNNLFGFDFTIFGNTGFIVTNEFDPVTFGWIGTPATDGSLFGWGTRDFIVSVSRHGTEFFALNPDLAPPIDGFAPTDGSGDPGVPVAPGLAAEDFAGATLEDLRALYGGSAGGASYDLDWALHPRGGRVFLPEIRFIRIDVLNGRLEIDAFAAVNRVSRGQR